MKICLLGTQGVGKTTLVNLYKDKYSIIDGVARRCIAAGHNSSERGDAAGQRAIFNAYLRALDEDGDYISTRSVIDVLAYTRYLAKQRKDDELSFLALLQKDLVKNWLRRTPDVSICYIPIEFELEDDGVRSVDKNYQKAIDDEMRAIMDELHINHYILRGNLDERRRRLDNIVRDIKNYEESKDLD